MTLKSYNLEGDQQAGKALVGNWFEERGWQDNVKGLKRSSHGLDLTAQPGYEDKVYKSTAQKAFKPPDVRHRKVPPRQARRELADMRQQTTQVRCEIESGDDTGMHFTRGRYLQEPQLQEDLNLDYLTDEPITLHSDKPHNFGRNSTFSKPIGDYMAHEKVKDV